MKKNITFMLLFSSLLLIAQQPTHAPSPQNNTPINLNSWFDILVFIIIPIILIVLYFKWRKQVKIDKENKRDPSN